MKKLNKSSSLKTSEHKQDKSVVRTVVRTGVKAGRLK